MAKTPKSEIRIRAEEMFKTLGHIEVAKILFPESGWSDAKHFARKVRFWKKKQSGSLPTKSKLNAPIEASKKVWEEDNNKATFSYNGREKINNLEDAIRFSKVDLDVWEVERHVFNTWETTLGAGEGKYNQATNIQIKIWFKKIETEKQDFKIDLLEEIKLIAPNVPLKKFTPSKSGKLLEIDIFDPHFGKLAWGKETGEDYDIDIAESRYMTALSELLQQGASTNKIEKIVFPIGNDLMHTDTTIQSTTAGTLQQVDSRWQKMWLRTRAAVMRGILMASEVAPVDIVIVPSNHDFQSIFYLGDLLECYYEKNKNIQVDNRPTARKYYRYGKCGIGFTHGNSEKHADLPMIMLREMQKEWSDVEFMEWHLGHFHKSKVISYKDQDDYKGIKIRLLRSLSSADAWHALMGYIASIKGAEGFIWDKENGITNHIMHNI